MRTCMFCGKDISHLKANAIICGEPDCTKAYRKYLRTKEKKPRFCEICGEPIDNLPGQRKICLKEECIAEQKRRKYNSAKKIKTCKKCGDLFYGTYKQECCEKCREKHEYVNVEHITQEIVCKYCGEKIGEKTVLNIGGALPKRAIGVCEKCKEKNKEKISKLMKENNPMFSEISKEKSIATHKEKYPPKPKKIPETNEEMKKRMSINNPMKNPLIRNKVAQTLKNRYASGEIPKIKGKKHWLWKGNRNFNKAVRIELRKWVKEKFEKVNYTCEKCGLQHTELHVHHVKPLRDIINETLDKHKITMEYVSSIEGTDEYFKIIQEIVKYHYDNEEIGIVVCPDCHGKIDSYYKKRHKNENKRN